MVDSSHRMRGILLASFTALLWGVLAIALKYAVHEITDAYTVAWFRFLFAFISLWALLRWRRPEATGILRRPPALGLLAGVLLAANYVGFLRGVELTGASTAQVLIQTSPLLFAAIGVFYFKERLRVSQKLGFLVAATGCALFFRDQLAQVAGDFGGGMIAIAVGSITWALWATVQKIMTMRGYKPQALNLLTYGLACLILLPLSRPGSLAGLSAGHWAIMVVLGANTLLAYGALGEALRYIPANQVSMIITLNPLLTLASMAALESFEITWVTSEPVALLGYVGALAMITGVAMVVSARRGRGPATSRADPAGRTAS